MIAEAQVDKISQRRSKVRDLEGHTDASVGDSSADAFVGLSQVARNENELSKRFLTGIS
jgi:hypothetical protein